MFSEPFEKPLRVWVGLRFPRQLDTVFDSYQFAADYCGNSPAQKAPIRASKWRWWAISKPNRPWRVWGIRQGKSR